MLNHQCRPNIYDLAAKTNCWKNILKDSITDIELLAHYLQLDINYLKEKAKYCDKAANKFPLLIPKTYADKIKTGDLYDPLLAQVLPRKYELEEHHDYTDDPVGDTKAQISGCLLQKYQARALALTTNRCSINCRFCFRKNLLHTTTVSEGELNSALTHLTQNNSIEEIILSGGEPLLLDDNQLSQTLERLAQIDHIKRIRFHTRMAITIPQRITAELVHILQRCPKKIVFITHCNHPNEIDKSTRNYLQKLMLPNVSLLNQSVLLKGVNDQADTLFNLSNSLFEAGIMPYYLHLLDKVNGTNHFFVHDETAVHIWKQLQGMLPGYLVPRLVREKAGKTAKTIIS